MSKNLLTAICYFALLLSFAAIVWGVVAPLPEMEVASTEIKDVSSVVRQINVNLDEVRPAFAKRLQGPPPKAKPSVKEQVSEPVIALPPQIKLHAIMFSKSAESDRSMATFSIGPNQTQNCIVGESVLGAELIAIEKDFVKLHFREKDFELKIATEQSR